MAITAIKQKKAIIRIARFDPCCGSSGVLLSTHSSKKLSIHAATFEKQSIIPLDKTGWIGCVSSVANANPTAIIGTKKSPKSVMIR